jgi:hypothetical protein
MMIRLKRGFCLWRQQCETHGLLRVVRARMDSRGELMGLC